MTCQIAERSRSRFQRPILTLFLRSRVKFQIRLTTPKNSIPIQSPFVNSAFHTSNNTKISIKMKQIGGRRLFSLLLINKNSKVGQPTIRPLFKTLLSLKHFKRRIIRKISRIILKFGFDGDLLPHPTPGPLP